MFRKMGNNISGKRWNELIYAVNNNMPKEQIYPPIANEHENEVYDSMQKELAEIRKLSPSATFSPVEIEYDDSCLDIYREKVKIRQKCSELKREIG